MINYKKVVLDNGLTVIVHSEPHSQMAAVNIIYRVGAKDEDPEHTGLAHLFEHLMFRGTKQIPDFDIPVQMASGENNAFTNNDYTNYYITLPKDNVETALWLESDRMTGLDITPEMLETEKRVVIEEYNQRYLNQPYGDQWLLMRDLVYKVHPYRWATIGISPEHISSATMDEVKSFYKRFYNPANAILSIAANYSEDYLIELARKWFADIPAFRGEPVVIPAEPAQTKPRRMEVRRNVPAVNVTIAFRIGGRMSHSFFMGDVISDILAGGSSARIYQSLVKEQRLFSSVNAYITGDIEPGLFVVTGQLLPETTVECAENAMWAELRRLQTEPVGKYELDKVKNKFESGVIFGELNVMNKAMNLGFYTLLGDLSLINRELNIYRSVTAEQIIDA